MRYLILSVFCLTIIQSGFSQDTNYDDFLFHYQGMYRRIDASEIYICVGNSVTDQWETWINQAISEINRAIPSYLVTSGCHVAIYVVDILPCDKGNPRAIGCYTAYHESVRAVYVLESNQEYAVGVTVHELMHAYGVYKHSTDRNDVINVAPQVNRLSDFDIGLLQYLYSQEAW